MLIYKKFCFQKKGNISSKYEYCNKEGRNSKIGGFD